MVIVYLCAMLKNSFFIITIVFLFSFGAKAQQTAQTQQTQEGHVNYGVVLDNDTVSNIKLPTHFVIAHRKHKSKKQKRRYTRLVRYVKKVYPYAKLAGQKLQKYDSLLRAAPNDRARRKLMKKAEKEIRDEYEGKLRNFTISQGKILVKLIDRETSRSSYKLLKELRGGFSAVLWQGVGRLFGYNLKIKYDPTGRDKQIEQIIQLIEMGAV
jgi:hypothetical protein